MGTFFQILGIVFVALVALAVVAVLAIRWKVRQFAKAMGELAGVNLQAMTPSQVNLVEDQSRTWSDPSEVREIAQQLEAEGFSKGRIYVVPELSDMNIWSLVHPGEGAYGVVYRHPQAGVWYDIYVRSPDGTSLTFTTASMGHELDQQPGHRKFFEKGVEPSDYMRRLRTEFRDVERTSVSAEAFKQVFESAYAEGMQWRNSRGGPTLDEIRRVAANMDEEFDETTILQTHAFMQIDPVSQLHDEITEKFLEQAKMSEEEFEEIEDRVYIVHDKYDNEVIWQDVEDMSYCDVDGTPPREGERPMEFMERLNASLPEARRYKKLGSVTEPIPADIYLEPAEDYAEIDSD